PSASTWPAASTAASSVGCSPPKIEMRMSPTLPGRSRRRTGPFGGEIRQHREHRIVRGDLPLLRADGVEPDRTVAVDHEERRTLPEAERAARDVVGVEAAVLLVREDRVRDGVLALVPLDRGDRLGGDGDDRR